MAVGVGACRNRRLLFIRDKSVALSNYSAVGRTGGKRGVTPVVTMIGVRIFHLNDRENRNHSKCRIYCVSFNNLLTWYYCINRAD